MTQTGAKGGGLQMVMLDRDGVLNAERPDSVKSPEELVLLPGAGEAVASLNRADVRTVVVTNQGVVGRGIIDLDMLERIHDKLRNELAKSGGRLDAILFCPDHPERPTERRKPGAGMLREALERFDAAPAAAPMVGDQTRDMEAAAAVGCPRILVRTGYGRATEVKGLPDHVQPVTVCDDLAQAVARLLESRP